MVIIDGESLVNRTYFDDLTQKKVEITLKVKEHLFFQYLKKLEAALRHK